MHARLQCNLHAPITAGVDSFHEDRKDEDSSFCMIRYRYRYPIWTKNILNSVSTSRVTCNELKSITRHAILRTRRLICCYNMNPSCHVLEPGRGTVWFFLLGADWISAFFVSSTHPLPSWDLGVSHPKHCGPSDMVKTHHVHKSIKQTDHGEGFLLFINILISNNSPDCVGDFIDLKQ